ncbi:MAG TPA: hypothetical protein VF247_10635 [Candidatus Krumholzibacteria bacterium]
MTEQRLNEFELAPGGPVDRLQRKLRITTEDSLRLVPRAVIAGLVAWGPLLVLSLLRPNPSADISFLQDVAAHVRFLLIVPLLVMAEGAIRARSHATVIEFLAAGLVDNEDVERFDAARRLGRRLIDSTLIELVLIALSVLFVVGAIHGVLSEQTVFWFERTDGDTLSSAGWWYAVVATPMLVFLFVRWAWRYLVWWWFLGRVARLDLKLAGAHPDRMGGLGFVPFQHATFSLLNFAFMCAVAGVAANRILYADASLRQFQTPLVSIIVLGVIVGIAPMLVFSRLLVAERREGWMTYGRFASDYVRRFEHKWLRRPSGEEALGSGDIQSLADLGGSLERVMSLRPVAIDRRLVVSFVIAGAVPALPLMLTVMPLREIVKMLLKAMM